MNRREVLKLGVTAAITCAVDARAAISAPAMPIIDSHFHLFDTTRAGGVPWPDKTDTALYKPALPSRYEQIVRPLGIVGAIVVEASPLASDNYWVLNQAAVHPLIVGVVGDLVPGSPSYSRQLDTLRANPLFVGIRYGNLWDRDLLTDLKKPGFLADLRKLAAYGLEMDSANPDPRLIRALVELSNHVPDLRLVVDHLPGAAVPADKAAQREYWDNLRTLSQNPQVFIKLSQIPVRVGDRVPTDVTYYKEKLDALWELFGEDRVLFGSDWPNSDHVIGYADTLGIVRGYISNKGTVASEKFFRKNSMTAYRWHDRTADQKAL